MEEHDGRSEATFHYTVYNISRLRKSANSPPRYIRNLPWKIIVQPHNSHDDQGMTKRYLGLFLQCDGDRKSSSWSCYAKAELRLKSVLPNVEPFSMKIEHLFYSKENDWGYREVMAWSDVLDPKNGYIKDDAIIVEVHVEADAPHGVSWDTNNHTIINTRSRGAGMEEYEGRSEATFHYTVYHISNLRKSAYSPPCYIRNLPWKILVQRVASHDQGRTKPSLGLFLQCDGDSKSSSWSCYAKAELRLKSVRPNVEPRSMKIEHLFYSKENNLGYPGFMAWNDVLDPKNGYIKDNAIIVEVHVEADAPHGVSWDSNNHATVTRPTITLSEIQKENQETLPILNVTDSDNREANTLKLLKEAIQRNSLDDMKLMLSINRININTTDDDKGNTPLQYAIMFGNIEIVQYLIESKANVCKPGKNGKTPLLTAVEAGNINIIKLLLKHGAGDTIQSAFFQAVTLQNLEITKLLIEHGVLLDINYKDGHTALTKSVELENFDIVKVLIEHGADVNMPKSDGTSPLSLALKTGNLEMYHYLINNNGKLSSKSNEASNYLLKHIEDDNIDLVQILVELGAILDTIYECGETPLTKAANLENFEMVKYLIESGANVNHSNGNGKVPLAIAASNKDIRVSKFLIQSQACIDLAKEEIEEFANINEDFDIYLKMMKKSKDSCSSDTKMNSFGDFDQEAAP